MAGGQLDGIDGVATVLRRGTTPVPLDRLGSREDGWGRVDTAQQRVAHRTRHSSDADGGAIVEYRGASKLKRHESGTVIVAMVETSKSRDIRVSSRRILFRHSRILSL